MKENFFKGYAKHRNLLALAVSLFALSAQAGDSTYGKVISIKSLEIVVLDCGEDKYNVRLIGIETPEDKSIAKLGKEMMSKLILKKKVQMRFEYRNEQEEMVGRILMLDPQKGTVDLGEQLVKAGLAKREADFDYKCGCLAKAEKEAQENGRGIWAKKVGK